MNPLVMIDMKSKLKGSKDNNVELEKPNFCLMENEVKLIKDLIHGSKKASTRTVNNRVLTLDEAVSLIKKQP